MLYTSDFTDNVIWICIVCEKLIITRIIVIMDITYIGLPPLALQCSCSARRTNVRKYTMGLCKNWWSISRVLNHFWLVDSLRPLYYFLWTPQFNNMLLKLLNVDPGWEPLIYIFNSWLWIIFYHFHIFASIYWYKYVFPEKSWANNRSKYISTVFPLFLQGCWKSATVLAIGLNYGYKLTKPS